MSDFPDLPDINMDEIEFDLKSDTPREMLIEVIDAIPNIFRQAALLMFNELKEFFFEKLSQARDNFDELPKAAKELYLEQGVNTFVDFVMEDMKEFRLKLKSKIPSNENLDKMSDDEFDAFFDSMIDDVQTVMFEYAEQLKSKLESEEFDHSIFDPLSAND